MTHVVILGCRGMLGSDVVRCMESAGFKVTGLSSLDIDIRDRDAVFRVLSGLDGVDVVINCAAYTKVDLAEKEREEALAVNGHGVQNVAQWCLESGVKLIHFSTDYVFDGTKLSAYVETDVVNPINYYGVSKLAGERAFLDSGVTGYLFRVQWLYGVNGSHFVKTISSLATHRPSLSIVSDQWGSPTWTYDIATMLVRLLKHPTPPPFGIYHFASKGYTHWADFARFFLALQNLSCEIIDITASQYPTPATRPLNSRLNTDKWLALGVYPPLDWQTSVTTLLKTP